MKKLLALALLLIAVGPSAISQTSAVKVETGTMDGASYRIDFPGKWNGVLLVYYHGYSERPVVFADDKPNAVASGFAAAGFAVIQSGYSVTGFALEQAIPETEALRKYTIAKYGKPKETTCWGTRWAGSSR